MAVTPSQDQLFSFAPIISNSSTATSLTTDDHLFSSNLDSADPDLTPRPLRIGKWRGPQASTVSGEAAWTSTTILVAPLNDFTPISSLSVPGRKSSANISGKLTKHPVQDACQVISEWSSSSSHPSSPIEDASEDKLIVRKTRRSETHPSQTRRSRNMDDAVPFVHGDASLIVESRTSAQLLQRHDSPNDSTIDDRGSSTSDTAGQPILQPKQRSNRAATIGTWIKPELSNHLSPEAGLNSPMSPIGSSEEQLGRANTTEKPRQSSLPASVPRASSEGPRTLHPRISALENNVEAGYQAGPRKRGAIRRVLDKFDFAVKTKDPIAIHPSQSDVSLFRRFSHRRLGGDRRGSGGTFKERRISRPASITTSITTIDATLSLSHDKGVILESPTLVDTAPNSAGKDESGLPISWITIERPLMPPTQSSVAAAYIDIVPEVHTLSTAESQSIWVAVDVAANVGALAEDKILRMGPANALDVVICLDLASFTSSSVLTKCKSIILMIAGLLQCQKDQLGVMSFPARSSDVLANDGCSVIQKLQRPDTIEIHHMLASIHGLEQDTIPNTNTLQSALRLSVEMLLRTARSSSTPETPLSIGSCFQEQRATGHVFILSSNVDDVSFRGYEDIQVHLLNPSAVPWRRNLFDHNGWQIPATWPAHSGVGVSPGDEGRLLSQLRKVLSHARTGYLPGQLHELVIDVKPAANCKIEDVIGRSEYTALGPGQVAQVFVKVKVPAFHQFLPKKGNARAAGDLMDNAEAMLGELDALLGERIEDILHVEVRYKHNLLPEDATVSTRKVGTIKRHAAKSPWALPMARQQMKDENKLAQVQARIGFFLASSLEPQYALVALQQLYGDEAASSLCPVYLKRLAKELQYQVDIMKERSPRAGNQSDYHPLAGLLVAVFRRTASGTSSHLNHSSPAVVRSPSGSETTLIKKYLNRRTPEGSRDEARKIWVEMRKVSRTEKSKDRISETFADLAMSNELLSKIADTAIKNKRSVGADTLKSLALGTKESGRLAPWL